MADPRNNGWIARALSGSPTPVGAAPPPSFSNPFAGVDWSAALQEGFPALYGAFTNPSLQGLGPFDRLGISGEQTWNNIWADPNRSMFNKMMFGAGPFAAMALGAAGAAPGNLAAKVFLPQGQIAAMDERKAAARQQVVPGVGLPAPATEKPAAPVTDPFAAFLGAGGAGQPVRSVTQTSGSPEALGMARAAAAFAAQAGQDRQRNYTVEGAPIPEAPKFQRTDYSGMDAAIAMLKPEEFAEDAERKKLALPYLMAGIAQGGFSASEDASIGTILFKMGMGALSSKALVDDEIQKRRANYDAQMREYARALANGEQEKARVSAEEANREILGAYEREVTLSNLQQPQVGADGSLISRKIDPTTGETKISVFTPGDAARAAGLLGQAAGIVLGATPRTSVTTQTGGSGGGANLPDFVKDELERRWLISMGVPQSRVLAQDMVKYGLEGELGLNEDDLAQIHEETLKRMDTAVAPDASPTIKAQTYNDIRLNIMSSFIGQNEGQKIIRAMQRRGLQPGASFVKVD